MIIRLLAFLIALLSAATGHAAPNVFTSDVQMCSGRPWVDVTCNGADPTGVADSTAAIGNTFNTAITNGWPVLFPAGTYKVSSSLTVNFQGQATNGLEVISRGATIDGRTVPSGSVLKFYCSGGTTATPAVCNNLRITGQLTVAGSTASYVVVIGNTDFSDRQNAVRIEHLIARNAGTGGAIQANYLTDGNLWLSGSTQGGSGIVGAVAFEQVQTSKVGGWASALGASATGLLLENGASSNNQFLDFAYDPNDAVCVSITSATSGSNTWVSPSLPCVTPVYEPTSAVQIGLHPPRWVRPAAATYVAGKADDGTVLSSENAPGATITVTLPSPSLVGPNWKMAFSEANSRGVIVNAPVGVYILSGQKTFTSITLPSNINYEYLALQSDGTEFRVTVATDATQRFNGMVGTVGGQVWTYLNSTGYSATLTDNGTTLSSKFAGGPVAITLPPTPLLPNGWSITLYPDGGNTITMTLNSVSGGTLVAPGGQIVTSYPFAPGTGASTVSFDGSAFRVMNLLPPNYDAFSVVEWGGAKCDGVTDDTAAIQATFAAATAVRGTVVWPSRACYSATGVTLTAPATITGENLLTITPTAGGALGGSTLECPMTVTCLTLNGTPVAATQVTNLTVHGIGIPTSGSVGVVVEGSYAILDRVGVTNFDTCMNFSASGTGGITAFVTTSVLYQCNTHFFVFDGWPEATITGSRVGSGNDYHAHDMVYFTKTHALGAGGGPNTITFAQTNFITSGTTNPGGADCFARWGGQTGSGGLTTEFRFTDVHYEDHTAGTAEFCSDSTVPMLNQLFVKGFLDSTFTGTVYRPTFALSAATGLKSWFFSDNVFQNCFYAGAPPMAKLAPAPASGPSFQDVHFSNNSWCVSPTFAANSNSGNTLFSNGNSGVGLIISGNWGDFESHGDNIATGNVSDTATGYVAVSSAQPTNTWSPVLSFGGASVGITYSSNNGTISRNGTGGYDAAFEFILTSKGSSTGIAQVSGIPYTCNTALLGDLSTGSVSFATPLVGLVGMPTAFIGNPSSPSIINLSQGSTTGITAMSDANFSNTTTFIGSVHCPTTR